MKPLLALKLRSQILAVNAGLTVQLKNVAVNGTKMGCSGFITDPGTGRVVYLNTDHNHGTSYNHAYYRVAQDTGDYRGGINHFSDYASLAEGAAALLKAPGFDRELAAR
ncbi:UNVERIFIED_ORG: hypothetical protein ABIB52_000710 [Arthrobacter sp. UYCu721]